MKSIQSPQESLLRFLPSLLAASALLLFAFTFFKNLWVAEDAYINFRSIEQLFAGNGPIWNPHERVQVFTSPLWYGLLATGRIISSNLYEVSMAISAILTGLLVWMLFLIVRREILPWVLALSMLLASSAFFDFTTSGLENPLAYLLIALFIHTSQGLFSGEPAPSLLKILLLLNGLLFACRMDLVTLVFPPLLFVLFTYRRAFTVPQWLRWMVICNLPVALWLIFAFFYYGSIFPNTAYAKLNTGIDRAELWAQGIEYLRHTLAHDPFTIVVLITGVIVGLASRGLRRALALGIVLNMIYVLNVGGDFMQGRFLSFATLVAVVLIAGAGPAVGAGPAREDTRHILQSPTTRYAALAIILLYSLLYPYTPVNSPLDYSDNTIHDNGIANERAFYYPLTSLATYISRGNGTHCHLAWDWGERAFQPGQRIAVMPGIGFFGLCEGGLERIIVDPLALADPFLARLPAARVENWRIEHFDRHIPEGYLASIESGTNQLVDPQLRALYDSVKLRTQSPELFSRERLRELFAF